MACRVLNCQQLRSSITRNNCFVRYFAHLSKSTSALSCRFKPQNSITSTAQRHALLLLCSVRAVCFVVTYTCHPTPPPAPFLGSTLPLRHLKCSCRSLAAVQETHKCTKDKCERNFCHQMLPICVPLAPLGPVTPLYSNPGWHCPLSCNNCRHLVVRSPGPAQRLLPCLLLLHVKCSTMSNSESDSDSDLDWAGQVTFTY